MKITDINVRDPFILTLPEEKCYLLFGSDGKNCWGEGDPWMVFCHEWVQIQNGTVEAMRLTSDLKCAAGEPVTLFHCSDAPWSKPWAENNYVTDGPMCKCVKDKKHIFCLKTVKQQSPDRKLSKNDWCWSIYE